MSTTQYAALKGSDATVIYRNRQNRTHAALKDREGAVTGV